MTEHTTKKSSPRDALGLLLGTVLLGLGEKAGERFLPLYLVNLGGGSLAVGLYQASNNLLGALWAIPGGYLSDRLGAKKALQGFAMTAMAGFAILAVAHSWPLAILGSLMFLSWSAVSLPAALDLITRALPLRNTAWGVSLHSVVRRIPMACGPLIGGALVAALGEQRGLRSAYLAAVALAGATLVVQQILLRPASAAPRAAADPPRAGLHPARALGTMSAPLKRLLLADILIRFCEQVPYAFVILWCMRVIAHPVTALQFAQLTAIEMVTAVVVYAPGAWLSSRIGKPAVVTITFVMFLAFPLVLLASHSFGVLIVAFVVRGMKELGEPTRKSLILDLCPPHERATHFGWYYAVRDSFAALGAALGAWAWAVTPGAALWLAAGFGLIGVVWYGWVARTDARRATESAC